MIITNDFDTTTKKLIERYARGMRIEQRLAEAIRAFHLDALAGAVNLNIDLDVVLRKSDIPPTTTVPWWGNRELRFEYT